MSDKIQRFRAVALDLDGTTLMPDKSLSERTRKALEQAEAQGVHVIVTTGRVFSAAPSFLKNMPELDYMINSNGAVITRLKDSKILFQNLIARESVTDLADFLKDHPLDIEVFTNGRAYIGQDSYDRLLHYQSGYRSETSRKYVLGTRTPVDSILSLLLENQDRIENISLNFSDLDQRKEMFDFLGKRDDVTLTSSVWYNMEIGGRTTSKASALQELLGRLDISADELMACGDSMNDAKMLQLAGLGVAMKNGSEEVRQLADVVTDSNDRDGVAKAIEQYVLA